MLTPDDKKYLTSLVSTINQSLQGNIYELTINKYIDEMYKFKKTNEYQDNINSHKGLINRLNSTDKIKMFEGEPLEKLFVEILKHQVANLNTDNEFYTCYTYKKGEMPAWVDKLKMLITNSKYLNTSDFILRNKTVKVPLYGEHGGPLVKLTATYEDGTDKEL